MPIGCGSAGDVPGFSFLNSKICSHINSDKLLFIFYTFYYFYGPYLIYCCTSTLTYRNSSHLSYFSSERLPAVVFHYCQPRDDGAFSRDLLPQIRPGSAGLLPGFKQ